MHMPAALWLNQPYNYPTAAMLSKTTGWLAC